MNKVFILCCLALIACSPKVITFSNSDAERAASKIPGTTMATLNEGQTYYIKYCNNCHRYKSPSSKNEMQWKKIVPKMVLKINKKAHSQVIDSKVESSILAYMITMSTAPKK